MARVRSTGQKAPDGKGGAQRDTAKAKQGKAWHGKGGAWLGTARAEQNSAWQGQSEARRRKGGAQHYTAKAKLCAARQRARRCRAGQGQGLTRRQQVV